MLHPAHIDDAVAMDIWDQVASDIYFYYPSFALKVCFDFRDVLRYDHASNPDLTRLIGKLQNALLAPSPMSRPVQLPPGPLAPPITDPDNYLT